MAESTAAPTSDFIRQRIDSDNQTGRFGGRVHTRFPPEPNGFLHIGHAKSVVLNFSIAADYDGMCNLRFDDTNPTKEESRYVESIIEDIRWLGFDWQDRLFFASSYFDQLHDYAVQLIQAGKAYVDSLSEQEIREYRGTAIDRQSPVETVPGKDSPFRNRGVRENLDLFRRMKEGEFAEGEHVLRARIDMAHPNLNMRDPVMYRIIRKPHHRTGDKWCIYPMYDFTHGLCDSIEGITHSLCTLEFENHRPLYDWYLDELAVYHPQQIEFARLNLTYTVLSKRRLLELVQKGLVSGWDDPRMPTIRGMRRRGYTAAAIRDFCQRIGVAKADSRVDIALLEHCVRNDLNKHSPRVMGVLNPLKVVIDNYPEGQVEYLSAINNPEDPAAGTREIPFSREIYIERDDFREDPPRKFFRLAPGREVRLRYAYMVTCTGVVKDQQGQVTELHCRYDPLTRGGNAPDGRRVRGTLHWVSAPHACDAELRLFDRLFSSENPDKAGKGASWLDNLNPDSLQVLRTCKVEPGLRGRPAGYRCQFERIGYFCVDPDSTRQRPVFNRTVALRDTWARISRRR